ncbi:hypothetical protein HKX64_10425 [Sulfitobacter sp. M72]|nr:hypothetical protein [Sulfitobacter sp. M60]MDF3525204.1 hypothetical protein [Sulfitobacter sp. S66]MDF3544726.1 hypothetical protein [Sulfitobacter sp. M72]
MRRYYRTSNPMQSQEVPEKILQALKRFAVNERLLESLNPNSQIVTDLEIWGDDFSEFYEILSEIYGTDYLIPAECIPSEFAWMGTVKGWVPFIHTKDAVPVASLTVTELDRIMLGYGYHSDPKPK